MSDNAAQFVGDIPIHYDQGLGPVIFEDFARDIARRAAEINASRVLELAAGTGILSRKLRNVLASDVELIVTDLNEPMLEIARSKFRDDEMAEFTPADAMQLDFPNNHFDLIVCQFGVMFFPDKVGAFREALRVLRPGGTYLFNVWKSMDDNPFSNIAFDITAEFFSDNPPTFYRVPFSYPDPDVVVADIKAAGFENIEFDPVDIQTPVNSWESFARGIVFGNPLIGEILARENTDPEEVMRSFEARCRGIWGDEPTSMPIKATVFSGKSM
ncbi:MAG: class I SAM-dependent methyltransferase [Parvularculaceae bacterium]